MNKKGIIGFEEVASLILIMVAVLVFVLIFGFNLLLESAKNSVFGSGSSVDETITALSVDGSRQQAFALSKTPINGMLMGDLIVKSVESGDYTLLTKKMNEMLGDGMYWELEVYDNLKGGNALIDLGKEGWIAKDWKTDFKEMTIPGYGKYTSLKLNIKIAEGVAL
ncbi:MAG: hypothetical protein Q8Q42_04610 [Nanoarchaeota archaeon]|nr:hypothetical protein [Nanoarchaeota archaeon]